MTYDIMKEKREAIDAGQRALESLRAADRELSSARGFGIWDMLGGGFIATMLKRSKMENAQNCMEQAKYDLNRFSKELRDYTSGYDLNVNTGDFLSFADWFFDGFFVDFMVQDRIVKAQNQVRNAIRMVEDILDSLGGY